MRYGILLVAVGTLLVGGCPMTDGDTVNEDRTSTSITVGANFVATDRVGTVSDATEFNSTCQGFFPTEPQHILTIEASQAATVSVSGSENVVVRLLGGQSNFCSSPDDPLMRFFNRGDLQIFVGSTVEGDVFDYEIDITATN